MKFKHYFIIGMLLYIIILSSLLYISINENDLSPQQDAQTSFEYTDSEVDVHIHIELMV